MKAYNFLENHFKEISIINQISDILGWDKEVIMPIGSLSARIEQSSYLIKLAHEKICSSLINEKITEALEDMSSLNDWQKANLLEIKKIFDDYASVDNSLMREYSSLRQECEMVWRSARKNKSFIEVKPYFAKLLLAVRKIAAVKADYFKVSPYQALVNEYDSNRKVEEIDSIFSELKNFLPQFIEKVRSTQGEKPKLGGYFPIELQQQLGIEIMKDFGFDFNKGRLDTSTHPFCGGIPHDIRLTTRYDENDAFIALQGIIHETGHALYEKNLPLEYAYQPVGRNLGMAIHESQSLLTEMQIGRSDEFVEYLIPKLIKYFSVDKTKFSQDNIAKYVKYVEPSFIRVDADEVTYPLHVIMRYELEKQLIGGDLEVGDLPAAWNDYFRQTIGLTPDHDALGVLQDTHWYSGIFGYFPSYTLGAVTAAQLMNSIKKVIPEMNEQIRRGDLKPIYDWLKMNIHSKGKLFSSDQLLVNSTGESLNPRYFTEYLESKYVHG
ncbi:Carboxypeptidase [Candidatus Jidaibacter acanthamoeba]|uniref:Metal-dependent carboxypeptidase n=1 Tax=Candidatus Jidaibacter acanthamoebae TaxID=86105 RepID=A0A0C1MW91_9RICK|nr:carboxypeptidase M32 [Candidatus Jidaibacter acanthamoeba]KIE04151.1 Carboxypeptidase [Candidatus Jidaibacter acanthamoeba]